VTDPENQRVSQGDVTNFGRVAIVGLGLIGGSIAAGLGKRDLADEVVAFDLNADSLDQGLEQGIIAVAAASVAEAIADADIVVLCAPVLSLKPLLAEVAETVSPTTLITDVGSVKSPIVTAAREVFGDVPAQLVPGHPIAGSERHGVSAANPDLFEQHKVILTPVSETDPRATSRITAFWQALGATVVEMQVAHHDEVLAETSHLPHLLAYALVDTLSAQGDSLEIFQYAAGGFRDFTRIAASDPVMWRDIFQANGPAVLRILDRYMSELEELRGMVESGDAEALQTVFKRAKLARDHFTSLNEKKLK
jgi:cyclohexadieny/prephenate dehydrogenase / 3-phosphoshikimate 1-carboxyvinyltransferase